MKFCETGLKKIRKSLTEKHKKELLEIWDKQEFMRLPDLN